MSDFFIISNAPGEAVNILLLTISAIILLFSCFRLIISQSLIESIVIMSTFSLVIAICHLLMDAPDVAMTETALGACLSTCVLLNLAKIFGEEKSKKSGKLRVIPAAFLCLILTGFMVFAAWDLPLYGEENTPLQNHISKYYLENTRTDIGIPSIVAAILASYRGYDTLGESSVILIAGLAVMLILARRKE